MKQIKIFDYFPELDAFLCTREYKEVARLLGLSEWHPVVWMGRFIARDQDFGEHIFDNWTEREVLENSGIEFDFPEGESWDTLLIVCPEKYIQRNRSCVFCGIDHLTCNCNEHAKRLNLLRADGPCHTPELVKAFWTEIFKCLTLSLDFLIAEARHKNSYREGDEEMNEFQVGVDRPFNLEANIKLLEKDNGNN